MASQYGNNNSTPENEGVTTTPLKGNILFNKTIYSNADFKNKVSTDFTELSLPNDTIDIPLFFQQYSRLFYNIPKEGDNSHSTLIQESTDYLRDFIDPKDAIIEDLENIIEDLQRQLTDLTLPEENPIFKNGTLIKYDDRYYFMDRGYKRAFRGFSAKGFNALTKSLYNSDTSDVPELSKNMFLSIPRGLPDLTEDNFSDFFNPIRGEDSDIGFVASILGELDPLDANLHPQNYADIEEFRNALLTDIADKEAVISRFNSEIQTLTNEINAIYALDPDYVAPDDFVVTIDPRSGGSPSSNGSGGSSNNNGSGRSSNNYNNRP